ncbi:uncharacterized protein J3D65DRAFT_674369 [Phyllosticta citribraziliensis]|uniref:Uncharacterized protein n=1 Tax=Phyllosticta citribraziliensis TaxID=989973 RepID=A0ABR1M4M5_9PEZI
MDPPEEAASESPPPRDGTNLGELFRWEEQQIEDAVLAKEFGRALDLANRALLEPRLGLLFRFRFEVVAASLDGKNPWPHAEEARKALQYIEEGIEDNPNEDEAHQKESLEEVKELHEMLEGLYDTLHEWERKNAAAQPTTAQSDSPVEAEGAAEAMPPAAAVHEEQADDRMIIASSNAEANKRGRESDSDAEHHVVKKGKFEEEDTPSPERPVAMSETSTMPGPRP